MSQGENAKRVAELTPQQLSRLMQRLHQQNVAPAQPQQAHRLIKQPIVRQPRAREFFPLSFAQQRLWFLHRLEPESPRYSLILPLALKGELCQPALQESLNLLVQRHESLRSIFPLHDGEPMQHILPPQELALRYGALHTSIQRVVAEELRQPFDLEHGPLLRAILLKQTDKEHILLLLTHHIVADGWSLGILMRELATLYAARVKQLEPQLPDLAVQYADFATWQREYWQKEHLAEDLAYWKERLAVADLSLNLPIDHPRPPRQSFKGAQYTFTLDAKLSKELKALSLRQHATLYMTLLASFNILLARYSGQRDILVGTPIANRIQPDIEQVIGFFVNTLVMRTQINGHPSFLDLLEHVRATAIGAYSHQELPFEYLVEELQPERDMSRNPIFQVMFILQNNDVPAIQSAGLTFSLQELPAGVAKFDLTCMMEETAETITGTLEYTTDLYDAATIGRMAGHYQQILRAIVEHPSQDIYNLPLLTEQERHQMLVTWNATQQPYHKELCIHELFEVYAHQQPAATALVFAGQTMSYEQLNARANQLAHYLRQQGVRPEVRVGLCVERSFEMIIGVLGILKAGGAYVPLDPAYPPERLHFMLHHSEIALLISQQTLQDHLPSKALPVICLDRDWSSISQESESNLPNLAEPHNLAYMIYTSGSTGQPKGVMLEHQGVLKVSAAQIETFGLTPEKRVLQFASLSFDASVFDIAMALLSGATLCLGRREQLLPGESFVQLLREEHITHVTLPPSVLKSLSATELPDLEVIVTAGEVCTAEIVARWGQQCQFFNAYGPTEATIWSTVQPCIANGQKPLIGRPISNTHIYILDHYLQPVPIGVAGEIFIGGDGLARGYFKQPELTAQKFLPHPFCADPAARLYRTGDLARYLPDGSIDFLGRIDNQVKLRGFRIEPEEIEVTLVEHPAVREAAVVVQTARSEQPQLVGYVVLHPDAPLSVTTHDLWLFLQQRLPAYMLPGSIVLLDALPMMPNGKVNRQALAMRELPTTALEVQQEAPRNELEQTIAEVWQEVLGIEHVSVHQNFFEVGGHSLLMIQVLAKLNERLHRELPLAILFDYTTISTLAAYLASQSDQDQSAPPAALRQEEKHQLRMQRREARQHRRALRNSI